MKSVLECIKEENEWVSFLAYKTERNQLSKREISSLQSFIAEKGYLRDLDFDYPVKKELTKMGSSKKRIVYSYKEDETWLLKFIAYKLYRYDDKIPESCYSFRRNRTAKTALIISGRSKALMRDSF